MAHHQYHQQGPPAPGHEMHGAAAGYNPGMMMFAPQEQNQGPQHPPGRGHHGQRGGYKGAPRHQHGEGRGGRGPRDDDDNENDRSVGQYHRRLIKCRKRGEGQKAVETLEQMIAEWSPPPTTVSFNVVIDLLGKNGELQQAFGLLWRMQELYIPPNVVTYTSLISACGRSQQLAQAVQLFDQMQRMGMVRAASRALSSVSQTSPLPPTWLSLRALPAQAPNSATYNALVHAHAKAGEYKGTTLPL